MAITVQLGSTSDPANTINKTYTLDTAFDAELKQPCSIENPVLILNTTRNSVPTEITYNYAKITEFNRYYFCTITASPQGYIVECTVDPLESFASAILATPCTIARNENKDQSMIIDESYVTSAQDTVWFKNFSAGYTKANFMDRRFILITV